MNDRNDEDYDLIPRQEFDQLARDRQFADGPWMQDFDSHGMPYCPPRLRKVLGTLKDGRKVRANGENQ